jgi:hypothetical protein
MRGSEGVPRALLGIFFFFFFGLRCERPRFEGISTVWMRWMARHSRDCHVGVALRCDAMLLLQTRDGIHGGGT